jgi:hypothetical protein
MDEKFMYIILILVATLFIMKCFLHLNSNDKFTTLNDTQLLDNILSSDINDLSNQTFKNPVDLNIDPSRNYISSDQAALDLLVKEVNQGNAIPTMNSNELWFQNKINGPNKAKEYRKISYADSNYRTDFNGDGVSVESQNKLDKLYSDAIVFKDSEYQNNSNFKGRSEIMNEYADAGLGNFKSQNETPNQKLMNMFNTNNYLPNKNYDSPKLNEGFQILNNPTSVDNPNMIPTLKSIGVNTTVGNKRLSSHDLRGDPVSNPKTVVSPFNNSSVTPDIYSTTRGCL